MDSIRSWFSHHVMGDHYYEVRTPIARVPEDTAARGERLHEAEQFLASHPTPASGSPAVTPSGTAIRIAWLGGVTSFHDADNHQVVNVTEPDHLLHPGVVQGTIEVHDQTLYSVRRGWGSGVLPSLNEALSPLVWHIADNRIADQMNPGYAEARSRIANDVMMGADPYDVEATALATLQGLRQSADLRRRIL